MDTLFLIAAYAAGVATALVHPTVAKTYWNMVMRRIRPSWVIGE